MELSTCFGIFYTCTLTMTDFFQMQLDAYIPDDLPPHSALSAVNCTFNSLKLVLYYSTFDPNSHEYANQGTI